mgnify:CR=1 FL=1
MKKKRGNKGENKKEDSDIRIISDYKDKSVDSNIAKVIKRNRVLTIVFGIVILVLVIKEICKKE